MIAAAACREMEADRGDPVGDSERGTETSPLAAIVWELARDRRIIAAVCGLFAGGTGKNNRIEATLNSRYSVGR